MPIGITPEPQEGICSICSMKKPQVRFVIDNERGISAGICMECALPSKLTAEEILEKYGKPEREAVGKEVLGKEEWLSHQRSAQKPPEN